jgi:hypothetical protein
LSRPARSINEERAGSITMLLMVLSHQIGRSWRFGEGVARMPAEENP